MKKEDKKAVLKMQKAYEEYVDKALEVVRKKLDIIIDFRKDLGKKKLDDLKENLEDM